VGDPIQAVVVLFGPEGFERSVSRLLTGFGVMEAQDEFPEEIVVPQRIQHCATERAPTSEIV
jgi:hypothetical protein